MHLQQCKLFLFAFLKFDSYIDFEGKYEPIQRKNSIVCTIFHLVLEVAVYGEESFSLLHNDNSAVILSFLLC